MKAVLIAHTSTHTLNYWGETNGDLLSAAGVGYEPYHERKYNETHDYGYWDTNEEADELAEFAGRNCYRSFHRPNPATAPNEKYLGNIQAQQHESVFEHGSATFYIEASRNVLVELERHRFLSFSVVSQRYVDVTGLQPQVHLPPLLDTLPPDLKRDADLVYDEARRHEIIRYNRLVEIFTKAGVKRKAAREAARDVLPGMWNSPMVVSGNHRAWRDVLRKRYSVHADASIRELAGMLLTELRKVAPHTYKDFPEEPW